MATQELTLGVLALTDSAPLVVAQEAGFFEAFGLNVQIQHQPSWATLRDKLIYGQIDAAQMLSPMPLAIHFGLNGTPRKAMRAPLVVSRGGNAVVVGQAVAGLMQTLPEGRTLGAVLRAEAAQDGIKRVVGTVFPYSMHTLQLRRWLRSQDVDPDQDVRFHVVPPARMIGALREGAIDLLSVGEPWGSAAREEGLGTIVATSQSIWPHAPEKVLGFTDAWVKTHANLARQLVEAVAKGCQWLQQGLAEREQAAQWLSEREYVNVPAELIRSALLCGPEQQTQGEVRPYLEFEVEGRAASGQAHHLAQSLNWMIEETFSAMAPGERQTHLDVESIASIYHPL